MPARVRTRPCVCVRVCVCVFLCAYVSLSFCALCLCVLFRCLSVCVFCFALDNALRVAPAETWLTIYCRRRVLGCSDLLNAGRR